MQQITEKIESLIKEYEPALSEKGLSCSVTKKYFEAKVSSPSRYRYTLIDDIINSFARKRENKYFKHQRNRHHCAVICFYPTDKSLNKRTECKEYSFMLYEITRAEEGYTPKAKKYSEEKTIKKIEALIIKILNQTEKKDLITVCRNSKSDFFRYFFKPEYGYKKTISGMDRDFLELIISAVIIVAFIVFSLIIYL